MGQNNMQDQGGNQQTAEQVEMHEEDVGAVHQSADHRKEQSHGEVLQHALQGKHRCPFLAGNMLVDILLSGGSIKPAGNLLQGKEENADPILQLPETQKGDQQDAHQSNQAPPLALL